jgi:hypothetical protein
MEMTMFRVEFFVDDKRLAAVLLALAGTGALDVRPYPVINARVEKKTKEVKAIGSGDPLEMLVRHMVHQKMVTITPRQIKDFLATIGNPVRYPTLMVRAKNNGILVHSGVRAKLSTWKLVEQKGA